MGIYGPGVTEALQTYATQFDDINVQERKPIVDLNAINPLSELREEWTNTTTTATEHQLSTTANTDDDAELVTIERGQYAAGYEAQAGFGIRIPTVPTGDSVIRWGYYTTDTNGDPLNGWYLGVDSTGPFVTQVRNGTETTVRQDNWSENIADGDEDAEDNPSGYNLDLSAGNIFQIEFVYYGYGPVKISVLTDSGKVLLHQFRQEGSTSVENTNLPLHIEIVSNGTTSDALDCFVGGRQFSINGQRTSNERRAGHYRDSITGVDDTQWYPVVSCKLKDGTDIGSTDFTHILANILTFQTDTDNSAYRWQARRGTTPNNPTWETPSSHVDKPGETAIKVDVTSTNIEDGSGNLTGVFIDGGSLDSGGNNEANIQRAGSSGQIVGDEIVTVSVQAVPGSSGALSETFFSWTERW